MGNLPSGKYTIPENTWTNGAGTYTIYVKATDFAGNESSIRELTYHVTDSGDYTPQDLAVTENYGKRHITWSLSAYKESLTYELHRSSSQNFTPGTSTLIDADIDASACLYVDNDVLEDKTYY